MKIFIFEVAEKLHHEDSSLIFYRPLDFCTDSSEYLYLKIFFTGVSGFKKAYDLSCVFTERWKLVTV
jgi:hypothetical protein